MQSSELLDRFLALLGDANVDMNSPSSEDVQKAWDAMRAISDEVVDDAAPRAEDGDGILAQYGTYSHGASEGFELDMTRQLVVYDGEEYGGMKQLRCTFVYDAADELRAVGKESMWSFGKPLDQFFDEALAAPGFAVVKLLRSIPRSLDISYGDV